MSRLIAVLLVAAALVLPTPPASAAARVSVANGSGAAVIDGTYATTLTLRGSGFQSIKNGHGGIYVLFGVVRGTWRPSQGGSSGGDYLTVPDSQSKANAGYAKFVAFPGSDTAGSANGGTIAADGTWTARIAVPGGTFTTYDAKQKVVKVDCRVSTCGVITVGAHGVSNARNETFTPVRVGKLSTAAQGSAQGSAQSSTQESTSTTGSTAASPPSTGQPATGAPAAPVIAATPALEVDRASARPGRVLSFSAVGLTPGSQVNATFEDGAAAVGPLTVGANGEVAGVLRLPADLRTGTYELRIVGGEDPPSVRFGVLAPEPKVAADDDSPWPVTFVAGSAVVLAGAVVFAGLRMRRRRAAA